MNPVVKLVLVFMIFVEALIFTDIPSLIVILAITLCWWILAKIPLRQVASIFKALTIIFAIFLLGNGFAYYKAQTPIFTIPWFKNLPILRYISTYYYEGLLQGISMCLRILCLICAVPILITTTPISKLVVALSKFKVPYKFSFTFATAMRFVPLVSKTYNEIIEAQKARAFDIKKLSFMDKIRKGYLPIIPPLILSLFRGGMDLDLAMESRAFGAPVKRTYFEEIGISREDYAAIAFIIAFIVISTIAKISFGYLIPRQLVPDWLIVSGKFLR